MMYTTKKKKKKQKLTGLVHIKKIFFDFFFYLFSISHILFEGFVFWLFFLLLYLYHFLVCTVYYKIRNFMLTIVNWYWWEFFLRSLRSAEISIISLVSFSRYRKVKNSNNFFTPNRSINLFHQMWLTIFYRIYFLLFFFSFLS